MREKITTALDILGILLVAAGFGWWLWIEVAPPAGLVAAGITVTLASALAASSGERAAAEADAVVQGGEQR